MENILLKEAIIMANSNHMCRLCLSANGITEPICYDQRDQFLLQKIYECTTLQISPLNGIPSSLCTICKARLDEFYQFRWQCIKNDEIIRRIADNFPKPVANESAKPIEEVPDHSPTASSSHPIQHPQRHLQQHAHLQLSAHPKEEVVDQVAAPQSSVLEEVHQLRTIVEAPNPEYNSVPHAELERRSPPPTMYHHPSAHMIAHNRHDPNQYPIVSGHLPNHQYGLLPPHDGQQSVGFTPQQPHPAHQFEFSDFRRKRGRPPKQKYDQYHHLPVKYGESSIESQQARELAAERPIGEPQSTLSYGAGPSKEENDSDGKTGPYEAEDWSNEPKIKLEQMDHQQVHYEDQLLSNQRDAVDQKQEYFSKPSTFTTNTVQTILTPDGYVKRSRGRPPREGGCPNQDRLEYRFQCQYCDARFKAAINLKLHTNTHTGERPYKCQLCDKSFAHPSNLSVHTKLHTTQDRIKREGIGADKKFQCPYCHTFFALAFQLKIHINTHTGQKPYVCKTCGKGFAQPSNLHVHAKKHCHKKTDFVHSVPQNTSNVQLLPPPMQLPYAAELPQHSQYSPPPAVGNNDQHPPQHTPLIHPSQMSADEITTMNDNNNVQHSPQSDEQQHQIQLPEIHQQQPVQPEGTDLEQGQVHQHSLQQQQLPPTIPQ
ncbi:Wilms tumor protein homolog [Uranotaenia lowii]|uniref:Wilms tumor protein homolog n=1 Tax=Uranotaenia lowii TaxID=190385 RepID=UPI0024787293|nr:Wilms tumor protein homolog [Uranotaenia lowii]